MLTGRIQFKALLSCTVCLPHLPTILGAALQFTYTLQENGQTIIAYVVPSGIQFAAVLSIIGFIASLLSLGTTAALVFLYTRKPSAWQYRHWLRRLSILSGAWCGCPQCLYTRLCVVRQC